MQATSLSYGERIQNFILIAIITPLFIISCVGVIVYTLIENVFVIAYYNIKKLYRSITNKQ